MSMSSVVAVFLLELIDALQAALTFEIQSECGKLSQFVRRGEKGKEITQTKL